jgi:hypothetical protein
MGATCVTWILSYSLVVCLFGASVSGCTGQIGDRQRLEAIRTVYSQAIAEDFVVSLHGEEVNKVLKALDGFEASPQLRSEATAIALQIRQTRERNTLPDDGADSEGIFDGVGREALPEVASQDPTEAIWMKALRIGAFRAEFERYWLGCFQPVGGDVDRWTPLDVPPCRRRPGMGRIAEVRFKGGQISQLMTYTELLKASAVDQPSD